MSDKYKALIYAGLAGHTYDAWSNYWNGQSANRPPLRQKMLTGPAGRWGSTSTKYKKKAKLPLHIYIAMKTTNPLVRVMSGGFTVVSAINKQESFEFPMLYGRDDTINGAVNTTSFEKLWKTVFASGEAEVEQRKLMMHYLKVKYQMANHSTTQMQLTILDVECKKEMQKPDVAAGPVTQPSQAIYVWRDSVDQDYDPETPLRWEIPNIAPRKDSAFYTYWKVLNRKSMVLNPGAAHSHTVYKQFNTIIKGSKLRPPQGIGAVAQSWTQEVPGWSCATLFIIHGTPISNNTDNLTSHSPTKLDVTFQYEDKCTPLVADTFDRRIDLPVTTAFNLSALPGDTIALDKSTVAAGI